MKISPFCIFDSDFHFEISNNDKNLCGTGIGSPSLQIIDDIRNQLSHVHTYLCHDGTDQLIHLQGEIDIVVAGQNVAK